MAALTIHQNRRRQDARDQNVLPQFGAIICSRLFWGWRGGEAAQPGAYDPYMRRTFVVTFAIGVIVAVFGLIWALQGFGVLGGSPMSNTTTWSVSGPITVLIGIVVAVVSWRKLSSK
jgi:hypothetical protein